ncbi:MAG: hypothetical protein E7437_03035 [Ruminococcaceae bacterium]|nr:hypothetical protein [Oscillospiraceae bacterium]
MEKKSDHFDLQEAKRIAQSPAGQKLLELLRNADPQTLNKASSQAGSGDLTGAMASLSALLSSDKAKELLDQLGR